MTFCTSAVPLMFASRDSIRFWMSCLGSSAVPGAVVFDVLTSSRRSNRSDLVLTSSAWGAQAVTSKHATTDDRLAEYFLYHGAS